jgi:AAA+ superfamily predicted ATPase
MHEIHLKLTEQVYRQASQRAVEAGFAGLDEFMANAVSELVSEDRGDETEVINGLFTPEVISDLDRIRAAVQAGGKTYSPQEVDEHFRQKSQAWREAHGN